MLVSGYIFCCRRDLRDSRRKVRSPGLQGLMIFCTSLICLLFFRCCTRLISDYNKVLLVDMPSPVSISSITIWDNFGSRLPAEDIDVSAIDISIGSKDSRSGCLITSAPPPTPSSDEVPLPSNYSHWSLMCATVGHRIAISLGSYIEKAHDQPNSKFMALSWFLFSNDVSRHSISCMHLICAPLFERSFSQLQPPIL